MSALIYVIPGGRNIEILGEKNCCNVFDPDKRESIFVCKIYNITLNLYQLYIFNIVNNLTSLFNRVGQFSTKKSIRPRSIGR